MNDLAQKRGGAENSRNTAMGERNGERGALEAVS